MSKTGLRFSLGNLVSARAKMSTAAKKPSHYDTLEVNSRATQSEIKTAYFKLSKQYHPDKNSSLAATQKFRDISEAYEILGNYKSRKNYDRDVTVRSRHQAHRREDSKVDPNVKSYQEQAAVFRDNLKSGATPIYDFDAWTKAHYGQTLERLRRDKIETRMKKESRSDFHSPKVTNGADYTIVVAAVVSLILVFLVGMPEPMDKVWAPSSRDTSAIDARETSQPKSGSAARKSVSSE